jgi:hypothetical protein
MGTFTLVATECAGRQTRAPTIIDGTDTAERGKAR